MKYILVFVVWLLSLLKWTDQRDIKIAIIGGGIGGTSCAHFLKQIFEESVEIYIYEGKRLGGRVATTTLTDGSQYETGAELLHKRNKYMTGFQTTFNLEVRTKDFLNTRFSLYNGSRFDFIGSDNSFVNSLKLVLRYGFCKRHIYGYLVKFFRIIDRLYIMQNRGEAYKTTEEMLKAMGPILNNHMKNSVNDSSEVFENISPQCMNEIIQAFCLSTYGQNIKKTHIFAGSIAMAAIDQSELWAVKGGNKLIIKKLIHSSKAHVVSEYVSKVTYHGNACMVMTKSKGTRKFDYVVYAAPFTRNSRIPIDFSGLPTKLRKFGNYHRTVSTVVLGKLHATKFRDVVNRKSFMSIMSNNVNNFFYSINNVNSIHEMGPSDVWRVLSPKPLSRKQLSTLFGHVGDVIKSSDWLAYPTYQIPTPSQSFELADRIYHINAIEWVASSMEMSSIGAKNVALLIKKHYEAEEKRENSNIQFFGDHPQPEN